MSPDTELLDLLFAGVWRRYMLTETHRCFHLGKLTRGLLGPCI